MKKLIKTTIALTVIGVAARAIKKSGPDEIIVGAIDSYPLHVQKLLRS